MKLLCLISAFVVLLLSARPCCVDDDCIKKGAEVHNNSFSRSSPKEKDCQGCSPFFSCGSCVGFVAAKIARFKQIVLSEKSVEYINTYHQPYLEDVALAIWQPPQLS